MVRTNVILSFCPEIHLNLIIEAIAAWPPLIGRYCPRTILTHSPSSLFKQKGHTVSTYGQKVRGIDAFYVFITKKHSTDNKLSLPLICTLFKSNLFTGFNLGTSHNIHWSMGIPHNKLIQNYVAHNNKLAVTVPFFSIESVCPV